MESATSNPGASEPQDARTYAKNRGAGLQLRFPERALRDDAKFTGTGGYCEVPKDAAVCSTMRLARPSATLLAECANPSQVAAESRCFCLTFSSPTLEASSLAAAAKRR